MPDWCHVYAEHVRSEDASETARETQSPDPSEDWTIVDDLSETDEPKAMEA